MNEVHHKLNFLSRLRLQACLYLPLNHSIQLSADFHQDISMDGEEFPDISKWTSNMSNDTIVATTDNPTSRKDLNTYGYKHSMRIENHG